MLKLIDHIAKEIGPKGIAEFTDVSTELKREALESLGKKNCPEKASTDFLDALERQIVGRIGDVVAEVREKCCEAFVEGIRTGKALADLIHDIPPAMRRGQGIPPESVLLALVRGSKHHLGQTNRLSPGSVPKSGSLVHQSKADNLLRLGKLLPRIPYDKLYERGIYHFMNAQHPNAFATNVVLPYRNGPHQDTSIIKGKNVLVLGSGAGEDDLKFIDEKANRVIAVDSSSLALKKLRKKAKRRIEGPKLRERLQIPEAPQNMVSVLEGMEDRGDTVDTVYSHSSLHYFDNTRFVELMALIRNCLNVGGHLAFAIKLPGSTFDGDGIKLVEDVSDLSSSPDARATQRIYQRTWLNKDGQIRHFRDMEELMRLIELSNKELPETTKLRFVSSTMHKVDGFDTEGKQEFGYFIYKKVNTSQS